MKNRTHDRETACRPSPTEVEAYERIVRSFRNWPISDKEVLKDLPLFLTRQTLGHTLFIHHLYQQILDVPGSIFEFGVSWGRTTNLFLALRSMLEPYNFGRFVYGFDTFSGFPNVDENDGGNSMVNKGSLDLPAGYQSYLTEVLDAQCLLAPRGDTPRFELIEGDATETLPIFLEKNPHVMCSLAYFDFDLYKPTIECLKAIEERLTERSILVFDEFSFNVFPGETIAVREFFDGKRYKLKRFPYVPYAAYAVRP